MTDATVIQAHKIVTMDPSGTEGSWMRVEGGKVVGIGVGEPPSGHKVRVEGAIFPGFIDAHVHLTTTGLYRMGLDFRECRSVGALTEVLSGKLESIAYRWVIGGNFDPGRNEVERMPTRDELDRVATDRYVLVSRADGHSCSVNSRGFEAISLDPSTPGIDLDEDGLPNGVLRNEANYQARRRFFSQLPEEVIFAAQRAGCHVALERGVTSVHEMAGGSYMGNKDFETLMRHRRDYPIHVLPYLATFDLDVVTTAGLECVGGDLFLDGSIGSRTAAFGLPYEDHPGQGSLYHSDEQITDFFLGATRAGLQAGVHAIGDAAIDQALRCLEEASAAAPSNSPSQARRLRHRIEHFECAAPDQLSKALELGVVPSVQPMFDAYWGDADGMYSQRLGKRALEMNPFSQMIRLGLKPAGGSDSTVTPLDPLLGIQAAVEHHNEKFRVDVEDALKMFTVWAAYAGRDESSRGSLESGKRADFCILSHDPREVPAGEISRISVLETWVGGSRQFQS